MSQTLAPNQIAVPARPAQVTSRVGQAPAVPLWTPLTLTVATVLFGGFPASLALAVVNWYRMGRKDKVRRYVLGGLAVFLLWSVLGGGWGMLVTIAIELASILLLSVGMKADIAAFKDGGGRIKNAGALQGILVGVGGWLVFLLVWFLMAVIIQMIV